ncbi:hypothetical protein M8J76_001929 [Diaphorina citri]|nr:hypothetical protein M8J76_001929 [Diaphorina citri]
MQNVSFKDMYNLSLHQNKYNGHLQVSHSSRASKKDRKGCKKGKIETILKNKMVNACNRLAAPIGVGGVSNSSPTSSAIKKVLSYNTVPKNNVIKHDSDDPYTFTDLEPTYHNSAGGNAPGPPPPIPPVVKKESHSQILKNILPTSKNVNMGHQPIKKENLSSQPAEKCQNIPPLAASTPSVPPMPPPPIFKKPNQVTPLSELKPPPKRRKSTTTSSSTGTTPKPKAQIKQEKSDTSSSKVSKSKDKEKAVSEASNVLSLKLTLPAQLRTKQRRKWKKVGGSGVKHEALQRIEQAVHEHDDVHGDLHSFGVDLSDSDEELPNKKSESGLYQQHWLSNTIDYMQREEKILQLKNELHRRLGQVIQTINIEKKKDEMRKPLQQNLLLAAREVPSHTALVLNPTLYKTHNKGKRCNKVLLRKRRCQLTSCDKYALPCATHCSLHILHNPNQSLFCPCAAVTPNQPVCPQPALAIYSHAPLCFTHKAMLGQNPPQELKRPPSTTSSLPIPSISTGTPTFTPPPSSSSSRKPRKKPATPAAKPRSRKKKAAPPPLPRGIKNHLNTTTVVNHTLAPSQPAQPRSAIPSRSTLKNIAPAGVRTIAPPQPPLYSLQTVSSHHSVPGASPMVSATGVSAPAHHVSATPHPSATVMVSGAGIGATPTSAPGDQPVHHFGDLGNDEQVSEAVLAIASMDPVELANRASRLLEEHENLSVDEFSDFFSVEEVSEDVLTIAAQDPVELSNQASRLLEHEDLTTVFNQLPPDTFEFFSEDKSVVYEPTSREEAELHRALAGTGDGKDIGSSAVDRFITFLDEADPSTLHPTLLFSAAGVTYPPNGFHSTATATAPAQDLRHS